MNELPTSPVQDDLRQTLARHGIVLDSEQIELLERYALALWEWNTKLNLTRHTTYEKFVGRDVVDALAVANLLETGEHVLDLGSGGGLPGLIIAIARPDVRVDLCESMGKKARVLEQIVADLGLPIQVYARRVQDLLVDQQFDALIARAVGPLKDILRWLAPHWGQFQRLLLIKGPRWTEERHEARQLGLLRDLVLRRRAHYPLAGTESESVVLELRSKDDAGEEFEA